jgi:integrase
VNDTDKLTTLGNYRMRLYTYVLPTLGDYPVDVDVLTLRVGRAWLNAAVEHVRPQTGKPWSRAVIGQALSLIQRVLDLAVEEKTITYNPFASLKPPRVKTVRHDEDGELRIGVGRPMNDQQIEQFLGLITERGEWLEALFYLAVYTGMRRGELLGLRWQDYDSGARTIRVRQQITMLASAKHLSEPKNAAAWRTIPLPDDLVDLIDFHRERWLESRNRYRERWPADNDLMFCYESTGTPMDPANLQRTFRRILELLTKRHGEVAGFGRYKTVTDASGKPRQRFVGRFRIHDLRHSANQRLKDAGVGAKTRAAILGHGSIVVNEITYTHVNEADKRAAIERVARKK